MITSNTLLDNSNEDLQVSSAIKDLIACQECQIVRIATGYWDIPGTALVLQQLKAFLQRKGTRLQLLIGTDPIVRIAQQKNPKYKDANTQGDYIRCDLQHLEVKEPYVEVVRLLKDYCLVDFEASRIQIKMCRCDQDGKPQFFHAKCYIFLDVITTNILTLQRVVVSLDGPFVGSRVTILRFDVGCASLDDIPDAHKQFPCDSDLYFHPVFPSFDTLPVGKLGKEGAFRS